MGADMTDGATTGRQDAPGQISAGQARAVWNGQGAPELPPGFTEAEAYQHLDSWQDAPDPARLPPGLLPLLPWLRWQLAVRPAGRDWEHSREIAAQVRAGLDEHNRTWLHDPDASQLDFTLCVAVTGGSPDEGEKLWGIVVGGSSSAKSEDIRMVFGVADAKLSDLTAAGLISWMTTGKSMKRTGLLTPMPRS